MKKVLAVLIVVLSLLSCSRHQSRASTLVIGIEGSPANLDPRYATDAYSGQIAQLCFEGLLRYRRNGTLAPLLARNVVVKDNTTILITLKKGIRFQDGSAFTAQDVFSTIDGIMKSGTYSPYKEALLHIQRIRIRGPFSLTVHLKRPYAPILGALTLGILPHRLAYRENLPLRDLVGTGPYILSAYRQASYVKLDAFNGYRRGAPEIKHLIFRVIPDDLMRVLELEKGSVDMLVNAVPPDSVAGLEHDRHIKVIVGPGNNYEYVGFNMRDRILRIKKVRQAIAFAINRPGIIRYVLFDQAEPAAGILPPWNAAYDPALRQYAYDPARARQLLDQAGFPEKDGYRFVLDFKTSNNPLSLRVAQAIAYELGEVGIKVNLRSFEWATFYNDIRHGNFQMYTLRWVNVMDPGIFYYAFDSKAVPPEGANRGYYSDPRVDLLIGRAMAVMNLQDSIPMYRRLQGLIAADLPYVSLWYMKDVTAMRDRVRGFEPFPGGGYTGIEKAHLAARK